MPFAPRPGPSRGLPSPLPRRPRRPRCPRRLRRHVGLAAARFGRLTRVAAALLGLLSPAWAQGPAPAFRLAWDAPAGCPSGPEVRAEVEGLVPHPPADGRAIEVRALVRMQQGGRWAGTFHVAQGDFVGERHFEAEVCADVAHAFALVAALALEPNLVPRAPEFPAPKPTPPAPSASPPGAAAGARGERRSYAWLVGAGAQLQAGLVPNLAPGMGIDAGVRWPRVRIYLSGIFLPEQGESLAGLRGAEGRYGLVGGGLTGCRHWPLGASFDVGVCARTRWGQAWAKSEGVARESTGRGAWGSAGALGTFGLALGRHGALRAGLEGGASVLRPTFVIENSSARYRWPSAYGGLSLGAELYFLPTTSGRPGHRGGVPMVFSSLLLAATGRKGDRAEAAPVEANAPPSFEALYDEQAPFIWRAVRRLGVPEASAADVVQEIFLVVHRRLHEFRARGSVRAWLYAIAVRVVRDYRRGVRRKSPAQLQPGGPDDPDAQIDSGRPDALAAAERAQSVRLLYEILGGLDEERREVFVLAELEQLTAPEIGEALGVNVNTVSWRLRTARREFQAALDRRQLREGRVAR